MLAVKAALKSVTESIVNPKPLPWSLTNVNNIGDWGRQGDLYFTLIEKPPTALEIDKDFTGQLAPGNSRGSRHIIPQGKGVTCYHNPRMKERDNADAGPILYVSEDTYVEHPDHGTVNLGAGCWIEVTYQVAYDKELMRRRVQD
jgi:hypothetical protein